MNSDAKSKIKTGGRFLVLPLCLLLFIFCVAAQDDLPDEIRGYKVYRAKVSVNTSGGANQKDSEAVVNLGEPQPMDISFSGVNFEIDAEISNLQQSGKIDFLVFKDFQMNGLPVEIAEYQNSFEISKNKIVRLPKPLQINVGFPQALRGVLSDRKDSKEFWQVTGRIFVFGHFKKGFFKFKRVIPIDVNLQIKNPIKNQRPANPQS